ncbi:DNA methylase [Saccharopolyspora shandongensis]|uniref:DNA methylase n=1 Tax=Saccharopolyspora shandongensis TaxID=418495 RepID=UPI00342171C5
MSRPRLLDLYSCAGGAGMGYHRAGFDVVGVDINPQPNYPFEFHQADAISFLVAHGREFDAIHASPPCQAGCTLTAGTNKGRIYPQLIPATRDALVRTGRPWIIENVAGAPIRKDLMLCGEMFGLAVLRHRFFELGGWTLPQPAHPKHRGRVSGMRHGKWFEGPYFAVYGEGGGKGTVSQWQQAMGITWTDVRKEIAEAIPPAYAEHIGTALHGAIAAVQERAA